MWEETTFAKEAFFLQENCMQLEDEDEFTMKSSSRRNTCNVILDKTVKQTGSETTVFLQLQGNYKMPMVYAFCDVFRAERSNIAEPCYLALQKFILQHLLKNGLKHYI